MRVAVEVPVDAPRGLVWELLVDWERQPEWMLDARAVEVLTPQRSGIGVTLRCPTNLLGATVEDVLRVTDWRPARRLEVVHLGRVIRGYGAFVLTDGPVTGGTVLRWWEEIVPPLGVLGEQAARMVARPLVERVFRRSLNRLAATAEQEAARRSA